MLMRRYPGYTLDAIRASDAGDIAMLAAIATTCNQEQNRA